MNVFYRVLVVSLIVFFMFGCSDQEKSVTLYVRSGAESEALKQLAMNYNEKYNKNIEVEVVGRDGYVASMSTKLFAGTSDIDIFFVPSTMIAELAIADAIENLDTYMTQADPDFLVKNTYKGSTYAMPIDISVLLLFYRTDLLPTPPQTWEEYLSLGKRFTKALNSDSPTKYGAALGALAPEDLSKRFFCMTWSFGGEIYQNNTLSFDSKGAIDAANFYLDFFDSGVTTPDYLSWGVVEIFEALSKGELAMSAPEWNAVYPYLMNGDSPFKEKIGVALVPGIKNDKGEIIRHTFQHAWTLVIGKHSQMKKEAYEFIEYAVSKEGATFYALNSIGTPARKSVLNDPEVIKKRPEFKIISKSLEFAKSEPELLNYDEVIKIVNNSLTKILTKELKPEDALEQATRQVNNL